MPSARYVEVEQPTAGTRDPRWAEVQSLLQALHTSNISNLSSLHARGRTLFTEGERPRGIYILRAGRAAVSMSSREGRVVILRMVQPGDVLGLNPVLRNREYDTTVKTLAPCRTNFVSRAHLIEVMQKNHHATQTILKILSREQAEVTKRVRSLLLQQTARARLAQLLLECNDSNGCDESSPGRIERSFTHEDIAQMICSSRETVTRLLGLLTRQQIIRITSDSFIICDRTALETMAAG